MSEICTVETVEQLIESVRQSESILVVGNRTKPNLSNVCPDTQIVSTNRMAGVVEYEPSEFTFTALAGTKLSEISRTLEEKNQYLPFDPMMVDSGATIAGALAAGVSGPGRHRFGGVRDFVLGTEFVTGDGQLIRAGGKVVKNAAGFDIPKLLVGSCGSLGAITSLTFKVFPMPVGLHSYCIQSQDHVRAAKMIATLARGRWELDAIDYRSETRTIWFRVGAPRSVSDAIVSDIRTSLGGCVIDDVDANRATEFWKSVNELKFFDHGEALFKIPLNLDRMSRLADWCDQQDGRAVLHSSVAGAIGWLATNSLPLNDVNAVLNELQVGGLVLNSGSSTEAKRVVGHRSSDPIDVAVKHAMDPQGRFPSLLG